MCREETGDDRRHLEKQSSVNLESSRVQRKKRKTVDQPPRFSRASLPPLRSGQRTRRPSSRYPQRAEGARKSPPRLPHTPLLLALRRRLCLLVRRRPQIESAFSASTMSERPQPLLPILVVNPNTTKAMTDGLEAALEPIVASGTVRWAPVETTGGNLTPDLTS